MKRLLYIEEFKEEMAAVILVNKKITVNENGSISIANKNKNLNISIDNGEHSTYF